MKLGANTVLFGGYDMETAFKHLAMAGYDGVELSAIDGMSEHLVLERWRETGAGDQAVWQRSTTWNCWRWSSPRRIRPRMETGLPGGGGDRHPDYQLRPGRQERRRGQPAAVDRLLGKLSLMAERYGVTLCVKAHVGAAIYNTPTTLQLMQAVNSPAFGIDMDPSHIHRAGENPVEALRR